MKQPISAGLTTSLASGLIGAKAPSFVLPDAAGKSRNLADYAGQKVVLFYYPKDDTEGCTVESIAFSSLLDNFAAADTAVFGISPDGVDSHLRFAKKYDLKVPLLADPDHAAIAPYRVWGPKKTFGREYDGLIRTSFLIDRDGKVAQVWKVARVKGHAEDVLVAAQKLEPKSP